MRREQPTKCLVNCFFLNIYCMHQCLRYYYFFFEFHHNDWCGKCVNHDIGLINILTVFRAIFFLHSLQVDRKGARRKYSLELPSSIVRCIGQVYILQNSDEDEKLYFTIGSTKRNFTGQC